MNYKSLRAYVDAQPRTQTLEDIAASLKLTRPALVSYLGGHRVPGRLTAKRLSKKTGVPLETLLFGGGR